MAAFPDLRWGSESSWLRGPLIAFSCSRPGSWTIRTLTPVDRWLLRRSGGRFTTLGPLGAPVLLLTTTGARTGRSRTTPLLYAREGEALVVVGSNFGQEHHPAWTANLIAHHRAVVAIGGQSVTATAELLTGDAAEDGYARLADVARTYTEYRSRTTREIRVFRLVAAA